MSKRLRTLAKILTLLPLETVAVPLVRRFTKRRIHPLVIVIGIEALRFGFRRAKSVRMFWRRKFA